MDLRGRLALAATFCLLPLAPLAARLAQLQVMEHKRLESRAAGAMYRRDSEIVLRADILDRRGQILARSVPVWSCFADRGMVKDPHALSRTLAPLLDLPASEVLRRYKAGGRFPVLHAALSAARAQTLAAAHVEGVGLTPGQERFYPDAEFARAVLGQVSSDGRGLSGVELSQDQRLRGASRRIEILRDGSGHNIYKAGEAEPDAPEPLRLTLDRAIQHYAEEALREGVAQFQAKGGVALVQDPNNGEILALAAWPPNPLRNPAVQDTYEPGSTLKIVTMAAALEEGAVREDEEFFCENGSYQLAPGVMIKDHEPHGALTPARILEHSSNIGTAKIAERLGPLRFYRALRAFGFGTRTGLPLPGETAGEMKPLSDLNRIALAAASYGYGLGASPLQVLSAYSAVANGGTLWEPSIVLDGRKPVKVRRVASARTISRLSAMLEGVVERGTGQAARLPGWRVAGKTGTSRRLDPATGRYSTTQYNASFAGYLPAGKPLWTILVVIEDPKGQYYGAQVAAPVFAKIARRLLALQAVPPDHPAALGRNSHSDAARHGSLPLAALDSR